MKQSVIHWEDESGEQGVLDLLNSNISEEDNTQWYGYEQYENNDNTLAEMSDKDYYDFLMKLYEQEKKNPEKYQRIERGKRDIQDHIGEGVYNARGSHGNTRQNRKADHSGRSKRGVLPPYPEYDESVSVDKTQAIKQRTGPRNSEGGNIKFSGSEKWDFRKQRRSPPDAGPPDETEIPEKPKKKVETKSKPLENTGKIRVLKPSPTVKPQVRVLIKKKD